MLAAHIFLISQSLNSLNRMIFCRGVNTMLLRLGVMKPRDVFGGSIAPSIEHPHIEKKETGPYSNSRRSSRDKT